MLTDTVSLVATFAAAVTAFFQFLGVKLKKGPDVERIP